MWRESSFKAVKGRAIVFLLGDRHRESGRNRWVSVGIHVPESLSRALEQKLHGKLPAKGLRMRRSGRRRGCPGTEEIPECRLGD